ncbi:MAG: heme-dependent peroxidase [Acidobacteria bacterium]|nr:heme-dependent peroxidase [Acidobacteriota bacterium]
MSEIPPVPLTIEGSGVLHQMLRVRWPAWNALPRERRQDIVAEALPVFREMERTEGGQTALFHMLGHKSDLMFLHFRRDLEGLKAAESRLPRLGISDYLEPVHSYLSVVELGLYESSVKVYAGLVERGVEPYSEEWDREVEAVLSRQREAMAPRLQPEIPASKYVCFYPMNRRRGEAKNWYREPMTERQRMMRDHGAIGRRYAGQVKQIISGSIGFDDWEWGVDLFADDALAFKKLIYEMRFDEVSAVYADFGSFYVGLRLKIDDLPAVLAE